MADKAQGNKPVAEQATDRDAFWLTDLYPDAQALFRHEQPKLSDISDKCIVVLDANVLLFPFEMQSASVTEIEKVYTRLAKEGRLIIPGQAAREFYKNRSGKIAAIADAVDGFVERAKKPVFDKTIPLLEDDKDYAEAKALAVEIINKGKDIVKKLSAVNERLKDEVGGDRVSSIYRKVLTDCVCELNLNEEQRAEIKAEVARRAQLEIAPGFKDHGKEDGGVGDYIIWKTILREAKQRGAHCIFVTEEKKPDWFVKRKGAFQPRPELLDEFRAETLGKSVHLIPLSGLLSVFKASDEVVQEVQELEERNRVVVTDAEIANMRKHRILHDRVKRNRAAYRNLRDHVDVLRNEYAKVTSEVDALSSFAMDAPEENNKRFFEALTNAKRHQATAGRQLQEAEDELREVRRAMKNDLPRMHLPEQAYLFGGADAQAIDGDLDD
ncbi:PIN-like domain-containing protein [Novosphingobium guangzhouense]|uniref:PIN-like domain-containing protein n=1 Tax=Novosphingobium guangzhouense TaxID=1850347 RepID=UPI0011AEEAA3|nr:PIN domain-containing protein [Novosphingobium guangzhouense]